MDKAAYLRAFRRDRDAALAAANQDLEAQVPCCPAWNVGSLAGHLTGVYLFWTARLHGAGEETDIGEEDLTSYPGLGAWFAADTPRDAVPLDVLEWLNRSSHDLEAAMEVADPASPVATWYPPDQTAGFVQRRMAQETAVHRWDLQDAHGMAEPIDSDLAADGIDEMLDIHLPMQREWGNPIPSSGESYHVHRTDGPGEWVVRFNADDVQVTHEHTKCAVALRGTASDLLLFLWGRGTVDRLDVQGDRDLVDRWFQLVPPD